MIGLGARLRALREGAGFSGAELAAALGSGWRQSKNSKPETGRQLPTLNEITEWAAATGADPQPLVALRSRASAEYGSWKERTAGAGSALARQDQVDALARSCTFLAEFRAVLIPGYLQTPDYMKDLAAGDEFLADGR